ncbi:ABC transporter permease [Pendulispora brunnea]|uniref:ABC transporter permease n=1 Tax=Pendulispora brunnea TaxID=2905690 RepID=A0ABZ2KJT5_9BACT
MPRNRSARLLDLDTWEEVWSTLRRNKLRVFLTAWGVFWGTLMLTLLLGFGTGLQNGVNRDFMGLAHYIIFINADKTLLAYEGQGPGRQIKLFNEDIDAVRSIHGVQLVAPRLNLGNWGDGQNVTAGAKTAHAMVGGTTPDYPLLEPLELLYGRHLDTWDQTDERKVAVIGQKVAHILYGEESPVGRYLSFRGVFFRIVGEVRSLRTGQRADRTDNSIFVPLSTAQRAFNQHRMVTWVAVALAPDASPADVQKESVTRLRKRHHVHPDDPQGIRSFNLAAEYRRITGLFSGIRLFVWFVSIATLLAGALGVGNILLITVKERMQELGIRKALGATPSSILNMVIAESLVVTLLAGYAGVVFGVGLLEMASRVTSKMPQAPLSAPEVDLEVVLGAAAILLLSGLLAALIPASYAARIHPIEALRAE